MSVKKLCFLVMITVILFVQEQLLSFIPNIQFTFLLIALYTSVLGIYNSILIVVVHVLLDNLIMGSFTPTVIIPMMIGYVITIILVSLVKKKNLILITSMVVIGNIIYAICFAVMNILVFDIKLKPYIAGDIPFTALMVLSTIVTMIFLYRPLEKVLSIEWNRVV